MKTNDFFRRLLPVLCGFLVILSLTVMGCKHDSDDDDTTLVPYAGTITKTADGTFKVQANVAGADYTKVKGFEITATIKDLGAMATQGMPTALLAAIGDYTEDKFGNDWAAAGAPTVNGDAGGVLAAFMAQAFADGLGVVWTNTNMVGADFGNYTDPIKFTYPAGTSPLFTSTTGSIMTLSSGNERFFGEFDVTEVLFTYE